jgi:hypothetical protein
MTRAGASNFKKRIFSLFSREARRPFRERAKVAWLNLEKAEIPSGFSDPLKMCKPLPQQPKKVFFGFSFATMPRMDLALEKTK